MKRTHRLAVVTLTPLVLVGCGNAAQNKAGTGAAPGKAATTITVWTSYAPDQAAGKELTQLVNQFNSTHTDVQVNTQYISEIDTMLPKVMTALAGNTEPDMVAGGDSTWGPGLFGSGKLVNLQTYLDKSTTLHKSDFYPGFLNVSSYKGQLIGIPNDGGDYAILYNKDLFTKAGITSPPKTWQDLITASKAIKQKTGVYGIDVPIGNTEWTVWTWLGLLFGNGGNFIDTSGSKAKVMFDSPAGVQALQTWIDLIHKYQVAPSVAYPVTTQPMQLLQQNKVAMVIDGPWDVAPLVQAKFPVGAMMYPKGTHDFATSIGSDSFYVFKTGDQKQQACWKFIEWFMQPNNLANWDVQGGFLPTITAAANQTVFKNYLKQNPGLAPFVQSLQFAHGRPTLKSYNALSAALGNELEKALYGQESAQQALDNASAKAKQILQQNGE